MILEPIVPTRPHRCGACRTPIPRSLARVRRRSGAAHRRSASSPCDQDDPTYVALDEATKHAQVDVVFARSFYAGAAHASGPAVGRDPRRDRRAPTPRRSTQALDALRALPRARRLLLRRRRQAHGHRVPARDRLARRVPVARGRPRARRRRWRTWSRRRSRRRSASTPRSRPPTCARCKVIPPPTETNFAAAWLTGDARRVRGRGGRVRGGGGRRRGDAAAMSAADFVGAIVGGLP